MHLTSTGIFFCSPFNPSTLLGKGFKISIMYSEINSLQKETTLLLFRDTIQVQLNSGCVVTFKSFISRDTCFSFIMSRMMNVAQESNHGLELTQEFCKKVETSRSSFDSGQSCVSPGLKKMRDSGPSCVSPRLASKQLVELVEQNTIDIKP